MVIQRCLSKKRFRDGRLRIFCYRDCVDALTLRVITANCAGQGGQTMETEARYLGVANYGSEETNKDNRDHFAYRFEIDGKEQMLKIENGEGETAYVIQNVLKEGCDYDVTIEDGVVTQAVERPADSAAYEPPVSGVPGERTLKNFLKTAMEPVGTTLYIYGGGWDWQDEGSAIQTRTIGVSPDWVRFFNEQDENFTYRDKDGNEENKDAATSFYPYGGFNEYYYAGLDCSGYLGWTLYNTLNTESGGAGYVGGSTGFAKRLAEEMGLGDWTQDVVKPDGTAETVMKPGDIMSINGHVWISLGTCDDGSVVITHCTASPSRTGQPGGGVQLGAIGAEEGCKAYRLADRYMSTYYPEWYRRYTVCLKDPEVYFTFVGESAGKFTWRADGTGGGLTDPEGIQTCMPGEVLAMLFSE